MKRLYDKYAPKVLAFIWIVVMFALSIGSAVWSVKWALKQIGVI